MTKQELDYAHSKLNMEYTKKSNDIKFLRRENTHYLILKGDMLGHWSRRINKKNRLVYCVYEEEQIITVISLRGHYSDK